VLVPGESTVKRDSHQILHPSRE